MYARLTLLQHMPSPPPAAGNNATCGVRGTHRVSSLIAPSCVQQPDARYGCGYRNIQVMLSFLVRRGMSEREYSERIYGGRGIPSVASLQRSIEISWRNGFDVEGAAQLVRRTPVAVSSCDTVAPPSDSRRRVATKSWTIFCRLSFS